MQGLHDIREIISMKHDQPCEAEHKVVPDVTHDVAEIQSFLQNHLPLVFFGHRVFFVSMLRFSIYLPS